jgi:hypothetical protein
VTKMALTSNIFHKMNMNFYDFLFEQKSTIYYVSMNSAEYSLSNLQLMDFLRSGRSNYHTISARQLCKKYSTQYLGINFVVSSVQNQLR